jgi:hypothetical protein
MNGQRTTTNATEAGVSLLVVGMALAAFVMHWAGVAAALLAGRHRLPGRTFAEIAALRDFGDPSRVWHARMGSPVMYWVLQAFALALLAAAAFGAWWLWQHAAAGGGRIQRNTDPAKARGLATRRQLRRLASSRALLHRASTLRPSLTKPRPQDVGLPLGRGRGVACWASVEDSVTILGPPRSGKGFQFVIPWILDYPGAVVTTSTRPDNVTATLTARSRNGRPAAVFDPQGLVPGVPVALRWSPVRGCANPQTAMIRAAGLTSAAADGVHESQFWRQQTQIAVQCLLHAAAVGDRDARALHEWSLSPALAQEAVQLLQNSDRAAGNWGKALDAIVRADPRQRDSVWAMVANTFSALSDPEVLDAVCPAEAEQLDPVTFLRERGTLYLLGTSSGASATAGLVAALIEDIVEVARRLAAASPGARLDPPVALLLDEAANYPLPSLPSLIAEGGGTGITTVAVLQSLSAARAKWGADAADGIWDSSIVKIVLGGGTNATDLKALSDMLGEETFTQRSRSWQQGLGGETVSESERDRAILDPAMIRQLQRGQGLLLLRSAPPIIVDVEGADQRRDWPELRAQRARIELQVAEQAATRLQGSYR